MSDVMERTLASIPRLLSSTLRGGGRGGQTTTKSQSVQSFQNFLKYVDSARGRSEQAAVVKRELSYIKQQFNHPDASVSKWSESFPTIIFCAMLGYDVSFCHIYTLKLAAHGQGAQKKIGYLAATLLLDPSCEITILMTGTLYKDLMSSSMLDNHMALSAAAELLSAEHIPMMLAPVVKLLRHRQAMVRARAVYCLQAFFRRAPSLMQSHVAEVKGMLGDRDPGVLMAVVTTIESLVGSVGEQFCDLTMSFVNILQQIRAYKFPALFSYHGLPLPWLQVKLLKILAHVVPLGDDDVTAPVITLLSHVVRDTVSKETMSLAILEESLTTITVLAAASLRGEGGESSTQLTKGLSDPDRSWSGDEEPSEERHQGGGASARQQGPEKGEQRDDGGGGGGGERGRRMLQWSPLLEEASRCVASFLGADVPNLRFIGVKLLTRLVSVSADLAFHHRDKVVHCLNDPDPIIRRQTLVLLQHMAVRDNFRTVCATMLKHAQKGNARDKADVIDMVISISHRLNSDPEWYLQTMFPLLSWRLDGARVRCIMSNMLSFFVKACEDSQWPRFPELLFTTVVESVVTAEGRADPSVKFSLYVLRLIPLTRDETFSMETFLTMCSKLVTCDSPTMDVKREVVLCVEALLLRGVLDQEGVLLWTRNLLDSVDASTSYHYRSSLLELYRLVSASVDTDTTPLSKMKPLFVQKTLKKMDYTLSFLDVSIKPLHEKIRPIVKILQPAGGQEVRDGIPLPQRSAGSENSEVTSSQLSSDGSPLYGDVTPCSASGKGSEAVSPPSALKAMHGVKQQWTKHGFNTSSDEGKSQNKSPLTNNATEDDQTSAEDAEKENTEEEDLAQALFQGLSPPSSVTSAVRPAAKIIVASQKSSSSSGFDSSSSQNSAGTSGQNTPPVSHQGGDGPSHQGAVVSRRDNATLPAEPDLESDVDSSEGIVSPPSSNSWRALHTACTDHQTKSDTEQDQQLSPSAMADVTSSDVESASHLSISDDSLENASVSSSVPGSPVQTKLHTHDSFSEEREGQEMEENEESTFSQFLEAQMTESENIQTELSAEGDIVNSLAETPESEDTAGEVSSEGSNLYSTFEILACSSPDDEDLGNVVAEVLLGDTQQT